MFNREDAVRLIKYAGIGGSSSVVSFGCYMLFTRCCGVPYIAATVSGWIVANLYSYELTRRFVFNDTVSSYDDFSETVRRHFVSFFKYISGRAAEFSFETLLFSILLDTTDVYDIFLKFASAAAGGICIYLYDKWVVFAAEKNITTAVPRKAFNIAQHKLFHLHTEY